MKDDQPQECNIGQNTGCVYVIPGKEKKYYIRCSLTHHELCIVVGVVNKHTVKTSSHYFDFNI